MNSGMNFLAARKKWRTASSYSDAQLFRTEKDIDNCWCGTGLLCECKDSFYSHYRQHSPRTEFVIDGVTEE